MAEQLVITSEEVQAALSDDRPVVALESTILAHGLPWPENYEVGRALEHEVRAHGAIPATVAVVAGQVVVGVSAPTLELISRDGAGWKKAGAADLGPFCARRWNAATTVSATTFAAARVGIRLFATGGIGGVHRGDSLDVSSDLPTLARHEVAVVCAGPKAILDLPKTLEALETLGVPVVGVRTEQLPAFYSRSSGLPLEHRVDSAEEAARLLSTHWSFHSSGVLICNPIPHAHELDAGLIERAIDEALADAERAQIRGKALTPHLLAAISQITLKRSLGANRALALANAAFAAETAVALARKEPAPA